MPAVKWLPAAAADLHTLHGFLQDRNPAAAAKAVARIVEVTAHLGLHPGLGRRLSQDGRLREATARFGAGAYLLRYEVREDGVVLIVRVRHSLQQHDQG